ncbi:MAG: T9SS type A sorting domain-containing protein [Prolixibacteraceae bacterium]|nr:T9SS type A sorting domain-containing protein [Prolixibacteraceae bacterium]
MKAKYSLFLLGLFFISGMAEITTAQLTAGDIAFVGFNSDNPDLLAFVALNAISGNDSIYFTDNGWLTTGHLRSGEGNLKWKPGAEVSTGTLIIIKKGDDWEVNSGSVEKAGGTFSLSTSGDQILAYQINGTDTTFITAIQFNGDTWDADAKNSNTSAIPRGLTNDSTALALNETDNAIYVGSFYGTKSELLTKINNTARWHSNDNNRFEIGATDFPYNVFDGSTDSDWNTAVNWQTDTLPDAATSVIIPNDKLTIVNSTPINCKNLIIEPKGGLTINSGMALTLSDDLLIHSVSITQTGSIIIKGTLTVSGTATVERYIPSDDWHIISSPVTGQNLKTFAAGNSIDSYSHDAVTDYDLAPYNETADNWGPYILTDGTNTADFTPGQGYSMRRTKAAGAGVVTFTGTLNAGDISINITKNTYGWNAVGNPYTSAILGTGTGSFQKANSANLDPSYAGLYVWDHAISDYTTYTSSSTQKIAVGQGFIIKSKTGGATINFTSALQVHSSTTSFKSAELPWPSVQLTVQSGKNKNTTQITFNSKMTDGLDPMYDAGKLKGNPDFSLYTHLIDDNGVDFAVQALPDFEYDSLRIPVGLDFKEGGEITFTAETENLPAGVELFLEDTQGQNFTRLDKPGAKYTTTANAGFKGTGRFFLVTGNATATANSSLRKQEFTAFTRNKTIIVNGQANNETQFMLYSIDGKLWYNETAHQLNQNRIDASLFPAGIYLLKINQPTNRQIIKLILN